MRGDLAMSEIPLIDAPDYNYNSSERKKLCLEISENVHKMRRKGSEKGLRENFSVVSLPSHNEYGLTGSHAHELSEPLNWKSLFWKILAILCLLYFFVCSLGFLSDSFRLIGGRAAGEALHQNKLLSNPIVGVMMGILVTVAVQSSSTSTSIVVSMVASGLFPIRTSIPIIMGANLGTSVTNTIVALTHMHNRSDFERAFSGAVLHDMFNLLTVSTLLALEETTRYLESTTTVILDNFEFSSGHKGGEIQVLSVFTKPFTSLIIQLNKTVIIGWSLNDPDYENAKLLKKYCGQNESSNDSDTKKASILKKCRYLFNVFEMSDLTAGVILLIISLVLLCGCLILLVKVLSKLLKGKLAEGVQHGVNANIPYCPFLTGYLAIGIGALMTILVQSSSVFTSALTPLIAMGMISLERAYPLTLGSNLGTTTTAMLAALSTEGPNFKLSLQLSLCHFLFNLTGILLFYPLPFMRFPIGMARGLGKITAQYRWFAVFYLIFMFLLLPLIVFSLSLLGPIGFYGVFGPVLIGGLALGLIGLAQKYCLFILPTKLRSWDFLPIGCRSLEPYDKFVNYLQNICTSRMRGRRNSEGANRNVILRVNYSNGSSPGFENYNFSPTIESSGEIMGRIETQTQV